jgi:membrane protein required for colicin V production
MVLPITFVDVLALLVIVISCAYAAWRGFMSEVLGIFAWAAAAFATLYFGPWLIPLMRDVITTPWLASLAAYAGIFLVVVIPLSFIGHRFSETVKHSPIGPLDRALGIAFGVVRGLAGVTLLYLLYTYFEPVPQQGRWIKESRSLPMIQATGKVMLSLVPNRTFGNFSIARPQPQPRTGDAIGNLIQSNQDANRVAPEQREPDEVREKPPENPVQGSPAKKAAKGYGASDRRALDTLLQSGGGNR